MVVYVKRNIGWILGLAAAAIICIVLIVLLVQQKHATSAALAEIESIRSSLTLELEAKDVQIQELTDTNELLQAEYNALEEDFPGIHYLTYRDLFIYDRVLPLDLVDTVLTYYKSIADEDFKTFKSVIVPKGYPTYEDMLTTYNRDYLPQYDMINSIFLIVSSTEDDSELQDPSFTGSVVLSVGGYYLYLQRENSRWYVSWWH